MDNGARVLSGGDYGGVHLFVVEPGTVVTDERSGESITVTETEAAMKGSVMWLTASMAERMRASVVPGASNG